MDSETQSTIGFESELDVGLGEIAFCLTLDPERQTLYTGASDFKVRAFSTEDLAPLGEPWEGHRSYVTGIAHTPRHVISGGYDRRLIWWDREAGTLKKEVAAHEKWLRGVVASPDGTLIATVADDMVCRLWDVETGGLIRTLEGHAKITPQSYPSMLFACAFSSNGAYLATADKVGHVIVWEVTSGQIAAAMDAPLMYTWDPRQRRHSIGGIRSLAFSPDGQRLATGGIGQIGNIDHLGAKARVEIFDWANETSLQEFNSDAYNGLVERMEFSSSGRWLVTSGGDNKGWLTVYNTETGKQDLQEAAPMHVHDFRRAANAVYAVGHQKMARWKLTLPDEQAPA